MIFSQDNSWFPLCIFQVLNSHHDHTTEKSFKLAGSCFHFWLFMFCAIHEHLISCLHSSWNFDAPLASILILSNIALFVMCLLLLSYLFVERFYLYFLCTTSTYQGTTGVNQPMAEFIHSIIHFLPLYRGRRGVWSLSQHHRAKAGDTLDKSDLLAVRRQC